MRAVSLREIAALFLKLGCTAFGGPAAHIALMEEEVVRRRQWLSHEQFLDLLSATNLIPGPNSTEMALHIGRCRAGWAGLVVAGLAFVAPATALVTGMAWAYVRFGQLPQVAGLLSGIKPVMMAVVGQALWGLGRIVARDRMRALIAVGAALLNMAGLHELVVLFGAGIGGWVAARAGRFRRSGAPSCWCVLAAIGLPPIAATAPAAVGAPLSLTTLFLFFLKVGSVLFGSGYVLLAFLRADLVERWHWLTESQLLDAVAVGQVTPGPLFTTATFIGYVLRGPLGAILATVGIFLPAFILVAMSGPFIPRWRASPGAAAFLDGVNAASLALMAVVSLRLAAAALVDIWTILLAALSAYFLIRHRVNSVWLIVAGGVIGLLRTW
ncbi:MAG: chromate efflux transporter [Verrucomicrobiota bacterium]